MMKTRTAMKCKIQILGVVLMFMILLGVSMSIDAEEMTDSHNGYIEEDDELKEHAEEPASITYRVYMQNVGWQDWSGDGQLHRIIDQEEQVEMVQIVLTDERAQFYDVYYRVYVQNYGWLGWAKNGMVAGTSGSFYPVKAVQICLAAKNETGPAVSTSCYQTIIELPVQSESELSSFGSYTMSDRVENQLNKAIDNFTKVGSRVGFYMIDLTNGNGVYYHSNDSFYSASAIKGPYVVSLNEKNPVAAEESGKLMESTIKISSNDAYASLRSKYGGTYFTSWVSDAGCPEVVTDQNYTDLTSRQLALMWKNCYDFFYSESSEAVFCRELFIDTLNSAISNTLGGKYTVYSKAGWIGEGGYYNVQNDGGIVMRDGHPYIVVILSTAYGRLDYMNALVSAIDAAHEELIR